MLIGFKLHMKINVKYYKYKFCWHIFHELFHVYIVHHDMSWINKINSYITITCAINHYRAAMSPTLAELETVSTGKKGKVNKEYII